MTSALSERQSRRVQETKLRIVNAMREYLATSTSPVITVEELCERADVARKTFYNHYTSVNQLQMELVGEFVLQDYRCREMANTQTGSFIDRFYAYVAQIILQQPYALDTYHRNLLRIGIEAYFQQTAESAELIRTVQQAFLVGWLQQEMAGGQWSMSFSADAFFEFYMGIQAGATVHSGYDTEYPFRDDIFDTNDLMQRYFARKQQEDKL